MYLFTCFVLNTCCCRRCHICQSNPHHHQILIVFPQLKDFEIKAYSHKISTHLKNDFSFLFSSPTYVQFWISQDLALSTIFTAKGFLNHQRTESLFHLLSRSIWRGRFLDWSIRDVTKETTAEDLCWVWTSTWCHLCLMIIMVIVLIMMMIIMPAIVMTTASKD